MKSLFIVANWKSNKTQPQAKQWLEEFTNYNLQFTNKEIILCPPFTLLPILRSSIINHQSLIKLGAQNISPFEEGAYTGEVNGKQIKEFADYVIIGHSERRKYFGETDEIVNRKIEMALRYNLKPILCISELTQILKLTSQSANQRTNLKNLIIAYEPLFAIGSGNPDTPDNASKTAEKIRKITDGAPVLYGGSVTDKNVKAFTSMYIDGVLVGGASLNPLGFTNIIKSS